MGNKIYVIYARKDKKGMFQLPKILGTEYSYYNSDSLYNVYVGNGLITDDMKKIIEDNIEMTDMVVVLVGRNTSEEKWIDWSIDFAGKKGKKVIFIYLNEIGSLPENARKFGHSAVGMSKAKEVIGRSEIIWETAEGTPFPKYEIDRSSC